MHTSRLWRDVAIEVAADFPDVPLEHALVDSFAMTIVTDPGSIEVVVTENTFGDILSDIAAAVTGGLGLAASASVGDGGGGIYEPVHGSAPDIAGRGHREPRGDAANRRSAPAPRARQDSRGGRASRRAVDAALVDDADARPRRLREHVAFGDAVLRLSARPRRSRCAIRPRAVPFVASGETRSSPGAPSAVRVSVCLRLSGLAGAPASARRRLAETPGGSPAPASRKALAMTFNDITVAYPGREGAHSAVACDRLFPAARLVVVPPRSPRSPTRSPPGARPSACCRSRARSSAR